MLLYVRDPELGVLLPAAGMPQTVRAGPGWSQFLKLAADDGVHRSEVELPLGHRRAATSCTCGQLAVVMLGGESPPADLDELQTALPLLAATLVNEQRLRLAQVQRQQAHEMSQRSAALSRALETARSEAARLNVQLREEDHLKDQFLAMLAHELRNPLAGVVASLQVLSMSEVGAPLQRKTLELMERQCAQLQRLVDDLMDVARVSHGRIELDLQPLVLQDVLQGSIEGIRHAVEAKDHTLTLQLPDTALVVNADAMRLTQVFSNLLHNAIKYTDRGGRISVEARQEGDGVAVDVTDSGIGIDALMLDAVFELFQQAPVALDRSQGGLGLGLTLARKLLALHRGRVQAHSAGRGRGSTFTVGLPLQAGGIPIRIEAPATGQAGGLRVLVIEDNVDVAEALCDLLNVYGHSASFAENGLAGLEQIERGGIDLVLLDLGLPDMDGYEVARRIRAAGHHELPVVALTGYGGPEVTRATRDAGFSSHCVKPLDDTALDAVLAMAAAGRRI